MSATAPILRGMGLSAIRVEIGEGWVVALASEKAMQAIRDLKKIRVCGRS